MMDHLSSMVDGPTGLRSQHVLVPAVEAFNSKQELAPIQRKRSSVFTSYGYDLPYSKSFILTFGRNEMQTSVDQYTLFQNGYHFSILLLVFKLALVASFLSSKIKRIFYLERGKKG